MRLSSLALSTLLIAPVACGSVNTTTDGGGGGDIDANTAPDADPHGIAKVTTLDPNFKGAPTANIPVVFINPDGTVVADLKSDPLGHAQATILPGASLTVVWPNATGYLLITVLDVKPGDDITLPFIGRDNTSAGTFDVTVSGAPNATQYKVYTPCGAAPLNATKYTAALQNWCKADTFDVYAIALDASNNVLSAATKTGVALNNGSTNITGPWQSAQFSSFKAHYSNVPADVATVTVARRSGWLNGFSQNTSGPPVSGDVTLTIATAPAAGTDAFVASSFARSTGENQSFIQRTAGSALTYGVDVGANLIPWVSKPTFDPATRTLSVSTTGTGAIDMYAANAQYSRTVGSTTTKFNWIVFGPKAETFVFPMLPADVGDVNAVATDVAATDDAAFLLDDVDAKSFDDLRNHPYDALFTALSGNPNASHLSMSSAK